MTEETKYKKAIPGQPLAGVKVIDASRVLAGPLSAQCLGDLGADVIKIEHPERGDDTRDWGVQIAGRDTTYFYSMNRNKRSIGLDLKNPDDLEIARQLAQNADVFIQNFKADDSEKLGINYSDLAKLNPRLIYCSITGYDHTTSERNRPGYDLVLQGETGLMSLNGNAGDPPLKFGAAVVDLFTGMFSAQAILAALYEREQTNHGSHVQMSLYNSAVQIPAYYGLDALINHRDPPKWGNNHLSIVPYGVFNTADDPLVITVGNNKQFLKFCSKVIDRPDLASDPRFSTNPERIKNRLIIVPIIETEIKKFQRAELIRRLQAVNIPCGEVNSLYEALTSQRAKENQTVNTINHPIAGKVDLLNPPYRFSQTRSPLRMRPPMLGEHGAEILKNILHFDDEKINNYLKNHPHIEQKETAL